MNRQASISIALGSHSFRLERFESVERLSEPFTLTIDGVVDDEVDFLEHLGKPVAVESGDAEEVIRHFHGLLTEAVLIQIDGAGLHYRLTLRPWFQLLDYNRDYRIFQDKTVIDIAKAVFTARGMKDVDYNRLQGAYRTRPYCVQYKESDFQFVSRLFEEEGIYYYFKHTKDAHTLVLCDAKAAHQPATGYEEVRHLPVEGARTGLIDSLWTWQDHVSTGAEAKVSVRSFDFTKPDTPVDHDTQAEKAHPQDSLEIYEYAGDEEDRIFGQGRSRIRLGAARAVRRTFHGVGDAPGLACGGLFSLTGSKIARFNQQYLITGLHYTVDAEEYRSGADSTPRRLALEAIPSDGGFRPAATTPPPLASGPETATVVGPDGQAIWVDDHGRVKVRFHWDRRPDDPGETSFWVRVSQGAAGDGFGMVNVPRVGQEVIIDFLQGDPDRPIIVGHVYDGSRKHPYQAKEHRTRTVWKTRTVGDPGDYAGAEAPPPSGPGFNEIRLEDKGGDEEVYVHAQRMMLTEVRLDDKLTVQRDRKTRVGRDRTTEIKHDESLIVEEGNETHKVRQGKRVSTVRLNDELTVEQGDQTTTVSQGNVTLKASLGQITIEAMQSITLKVGQSSIVIDQTGVTVKGMMVTSEAQAIQKVKGSMTQVEGAAMTTVKGALVMIN
jgi:type VI secretion system secreted protein VgrG